MPHSVMLFERHPLDAFCAPRNIAVIGATGESRQRRIGGVF
jgi:hypothetical protein